MNMNVRGFREQNRRPLEQGTGRFPPTGPLAGRSQRPELLQGGAVGPHRGTLTPVRFISSSKTTSTAEATP